MGLNGEIQNFSGVGAEGRRLELLVAQRERTGRRKSLLQECPVITGGKIMSQASCNPLNTFKGQSQGKPYRVSVCVSFH